RLLLASERLLGGRHDSSDPDEAVRLFSRQAARLATVRKRLARQHDTIEFSRCQPAAVQQMLHGADRQPAPDHPDHLNAVRGLAAEDLPTPDQREQFAPYG